MGAPLPPASLAKVIDKKSICSVCPVSGSQGSRLPFRAGRRSASAFGASWYITRTPRPAQGGICEMRVSPHPVHNSAGGGGTSAPPTRCSGFAGSALLRTLLRPCPCILTNAPKIGSHALVAWSWTGIANRRAPRSLNCVLLYSTYLYWGFFRLLSAR